MSDFDINLGDISFLIAVSLLHAFQVASNAAMVGASRRKHKINPPEMNGPPEFIRTLRVQANDLEFALTFQVALWTCGLTTHQALACIVGLGYVYSRRMYKIGYIEAAEKRVRGFRQSVKCLKTLTFLTVFGLVNIWLNQFANIDVFAMVKQTLIPGTKDEL